MCRGESGQHRFMKGHSRGLDHEYELYQGDVFDEEAMMFLVRTVGIWKSWI